MQDAGRSWLQLGHPLEAYGQVPWCLELGLEDRVARRVSREQRAIQLERSVDFVDGPQWRLRGRLPHEVLELAAHHLCVWGSQTSVVRVESVGLPLDIHFHGKRQSKVRWLMGVNQPGKTAVIATPPFPVGI